jgi:hypothetical protein
MTTKNPKPETRNSKPARKSPGWRNRIVGHGTKPANEFKFNPLNYRRHPEDQREAVRKMLGVVGWVTEVIENVRTGNLIDGQARIEEALRQDPEQLIPFTQVDLSLEEEKAVLASLDPMTGMAEHDAETLQQLLDETIAEMPDLEELLKSLHTIDVEEPDEPKSRTAVFTEHIRLVIECKSRRQQTKLLKRFEEEGLEVRAT